MKVSSDMLSVISRQIADLYIIPQVSITARDTQQLRRNETPFITFLVVGVRLLGKFG